jgi:poly-gamma-glutamate synthesis protein (capsule biosynthesis protein)
MVCYSYTMKMVDGVPSLNGGLPLEEPELVNWFTYEDLPGFYSQIESVQKNMRSSGADATVVFIHWGEEYQLRPNTHQTTIAQKLCDLGIDAIVGGHPHVVQPMDLLTSTVDPAHKTVCLYSLGNAVSNQRLGNLQSINTAHTEDGMLFSVTFAKYSDGTVALEATDVLPCWVNVRYDTAKEYNILPLDADTMDQWQTLYNLSEGTFNAAKKSYDRTMALVGEGLEECQTYLAEAKQQREADYLAALENP